MNDNDLIKHGEMFFPALDGYVLRSKVISLLYKAGFRKAADYCKALLVVPTVEQPMSAVEYLKERNRMESWSAENCNQASLDCDDECCKCPYGRVPNCKDEANRPLEAIAIVEAWAKEYPERSIE